MTKKKLQKLRSILAGLQMGPLNSTPLGPRGAKKSARLLLSKNSQTSFSTQASFPFFLPENLMPAHATEIFKTVASDPNATEDTKDPVGDAEQDEDDLDKVQNRLFSSSILTEDRVANHQVAEACYSHREQPIPCRMT